MCETEGDRDKKQKYKTNERGKELEELSDGLGRQEQIETTEETCNTFFI